MIFAQSLVYLQNRPPKEYVESVLNRYAVPDNIAKMLKNRFGIE